MNEDFEVSGNTEVRDTIMPEIKAEKKPFEQWHKEKAPNWLPALSVQLHANWPGEGYEVTESEFDSALKELLGLPIGYQKVGTK